MHMENHQTRWPDGGVNTWEIHGTQWLVGTAMATEEHEEYTKKMFHWNRMPFRGAALGHLGHDGHALPLTPVEEDDEGPRGFAT